MNYTLFFRRPKNMMKPFNNSLLNKDAHLRISPMAPEGPRGSSGSRLNDFSGHLAKVRRIRTYPPDSPVLNNLIKLHFPRAPDFLLMGSLNYKNNMYSTNRPKGLNCLFLRGTYENSSSGYIFSDHLRPKRSSNVNDRPWFSIFRLILTS